MIAPDTWRAIEAIRTALTNIRISNGYRTDAGARVLLDAFQLGESDEYPTLRIVEDEIEETETGSADDAITLTIEGYIDQLADGAQRKAHDLRDDVLKVLRALRKPRQAPAPIVGIAVLARRVLQRPEGFRYVICQVGVRVRLVTQSPA